MTSYRNEVGAWDGGPPGAEGDYAPLPAVPPPAPVPTTDPWTGVSYNQYPSNYDYQSYGGPQYGYSYDSSYYQRADSYYDAQTTYPGQYQSNYGYTKPLDQPSGDNRKYLHRRSSFKSKSRSCSPYNRRDREHSKSKYSYDRHKSKSISLSKRKYTPSRSSSRSKSRSFTRSPVQRKRRSASSYSDISKNYQNSRRSDRSLTSSDKIRKSKSFHGSSSESSKRRSRSLSPRYRTKKEKWNTEYNTEKSRSNSPGTESEKPESRCISPKDSVSFLKKSRVRSGFNEKKIKDKQVRNLTPPKRNMKSPSSHVKLEKRSVTPSKGRRAHKSTTSPKRIKLKDRRTLISDRPRESSVTPPRCYARSPSSSKSRSSRSLTPKDRLRTKSRRRSSSSSDSYARKTSRSRSEIQSKRKSVTREKSSSSSPSRERHRKSRSKSRLHSRAHRSRSNTRKSKSRSRSRSSHSSSRSGTKTPSDDERRGQFTVADRKRYWKLHRHNQGRAKSPMEIKPPPGAIETTKVDDIDYGDPPEVEGPNFAELLPPPSLVAVPSNSKIIKTPLPIPIKNDGSFLEMFKKLQEETKKQEEIKKPAIRKPVLPFIGKRRGGRVLKTGLVKKAKAIDEQTIDNTPKDAWSLYMQEVKKYRETSCEEERKTRPLVK